MSNVIRRVTASPLVPVNAPGEFLDPVPRRGEGLTVTTQVCLGAQPQVLIHWEADYQQWRSGYKVLGFRSNTGFAPQLRPKDLSAHGQLTIEEAADGSRQELLPEGVYYYTFLLRSAGLFFDTMTEPVRFSLEIPSARTALGRLKDHRELHDMQLTTELAPAEAEIRRNEVEARLHRSRQALAKLTEAKEEEDPVEAAVRRDVEPIVRKAMVEARTVVELEMQRAMLTESLKLHPGWKKLKPSQRRRILDQIAKSLDPDEATWNA